MLSPNNLDRVENLSEIVKLNTGLETTISPGSTIVITLSMKSSNKSEIEQTLKNGLNLIFKRHLEKTEFYHKSGAETYMSKIVSDIKISEVSVSQNRIFIILIGIVSGLILGMFIVFVRNFFDFYMAQTK